MGNAIPILEMNVHEPIVFLWPGRSSVAVATASLLLGTGAETRIEAYVEFSDGSLIVDTERIRFTVGEPREPSQPKLATARRELGLC